MVLWGVLLRVTLGLHATWLVNSATHPWGSRRFETRDDSRNSWWVALLTGGEGWHNNHHAHPVSARHGLKWYEIDPNFWGTWPKRSKWPSTIPPTPSPPGSKTSSFEASRGLLAPVRILNESGIPAFERTLISRLYPGNDFTAC